MRCANCRVPQYCSRDCQRVHWKEEIRPHKAVCAILTHVRKICPFDIVTGKLDAAAFAAACCSAGIKVEELIQPLAHINTTYSALNLTEAMGIQRALFLSLTYFVFIC